jgi:hypothetical protein
MNSQYFQVGIDDPTKKETFAPKGALYARAGDLGGTLYQKQDEGASCNWKLVGAIELDLGEGSVDLNAIISKKENIGVAAQLNQNLRTELVRLIDLKFAENNERDDKKINDAITQMNQTLETVLNQTVNNKIQAFFIDKDKDFAAQVLSIKNSIESEILAALTSKMNTIGQSITSNVTEAVKASSQIARDALVLEFRARIDTAYNNFKLDLTKTTEDKIKATFDSVCAVAMQSAKESYDQMVSEVKIQSDEFKTASKEFLERSAVNYDVINEYLQTFETSLNNKVNGQITTFFDQSKKDFYDKLKTEFNLSINKAVQEMQIYVNGKIN